jgi:methionyl-tRNA synthetase
MKHYFSFGNFVNRALKFVQAKFNGIIPDGGDEAGPLPTEDEDKEFVTEVNHLLRQYVEQGDSVKIRAALQTIMLISAQGNLYLQKAGLGNALLAENPKRCAQVISRAVNLIYMLSAAVYPYMPSTSESILRQLNAPHRTIDTVLSTDILAGHMIGIPEHLFTKIDEKKADEWKFRFGTSEQTAPAVEQPKKTADGKPISKKQAEKAKKQAEKELAAARAQQAKPKSSKVLEIEELIKSQGNNVRQLKAEKASSEAVQEAVVALNKLKLDLKVAEEG